MFGAAVMLDYDFNLKREVIVDLPQVQTSTLERIIVGEYRVGIQEEDIKDCSFRFYKVFYRNYIGEIQEHIISVITYKLASLTILPYYELLNAHQTKPTTIPFTPYEQVLLEITKEQLLHFFQKILTIISEGSHFYFLSHNAVFFNREFKCLEFIGLPLDYTDYENEENFSKKISDCEYKSCKEVLMLFEVCKMIVSKVWTEGQQILVGNRLFTSNCIEINREPYLLCLSHQIGLPYYWFLFHGHTYKEDESLLGIKMKRKFLVYQINGLYFYYEGSINHKNEKHSVDSQCYIFCFTARQKEEIDSTVLQIIQKRKEENNQIGIEERRKIERLFDLNMTKNSNLIFAGYLKNNLPHGQCQIKSFLNPNYLRLEAGAGVFSDSDVSLFKIHLEVRFINGVMNGEGFFHINEEEKNLIYFDHFVDIAITNQDKITNLSEHRGSWIKRELERGRIVDILKNKQYNYMHIKASSNTEFGDGYHLRQFRSIFLQEKPNKVIQKNLRKIFINIGQNSNEVNCEKLFLKTKSNQYGVVHVYILSNDHEKVSPVLAENILFSFTESYSSDNTNSHYLTYIDLSMISDVSQLNFSSLVNPSETIIEGLYSKFSELPEIMREFVFQQIIYLDFSFSDKLFKEYKNPITANFYEPVIYKLSNSQGNNNNQMIQRRDTLPRRQHSSQSIYKKGLILKGCDLTDISCSRKLSQIYLFHLNISGATVPSNILDSLGTEQLQFLRYLNISYTELLYSSVYNFFVQQNPAEYITTFICRGVEINSYRSRKDLFNHIIESKLLMFATYLDLSDNDFVNDKLIRKVYGFMTKLETLKVSSCSSLDADSHQYFYQKMANVIPVLKKMDFSGNKISFSFVSQQEDYRSIEVLDITNCVFKDVQYLFTFLKTQTQLYKLKLDFSRFAHDNFEFLEKVFTHCPSLRKIYVLVKLTDNFSLNSIQKPIGKIIECPELNIYFYTQNSKDGNKGVYHLKHEANYNRLLKNNIYETGLYSLSNVNIHLGNYQIVKNQDAQNAIQIMFNYQKLKGLKYGLVYTPTQDHSEVNQKSSLIQKLKATLQNDVNTLNLSDQIYDIYQIQSLLQIYKNITTLVFFHDRNHDNQNNKCLELMLNTNQTNLTKIRCGASFTINEEYQASNLIELQMDKLTINCTENFSFKSLEKLEVIVLNTLFLNFSSVKQKDIQFVRQFIVATTVLQTLHITFDLSKQPEQNQTQLKTIFQHLNSKAFTQCKKLIFNLIGAVNKQASLKEISTLIHNMTKCQELHIKCTQLETIGDPAILFSDLTNSIHHQYHTIKLSVKQLDELMFAFIKSQKLVDHLILEINSFTNYKQVEFFSNPIKRLDVTTKAIEKERRKIKEELSKLFSSKDCKIKEFYFMDEQIRK